MIRFLLDGEVIESEAGAQTSALELIRTQLGRKGTKEGCNEGDCGACTVLLGEIKGDGVQWRAVNACILLAPMLDGKALATVESLGTPDHLAPCSSRWWNATAASAAFAPRLHHEP
jgi:xanthine dehydrogenase small subunit